MIHNNKPQIIINKCLKPVIYLDTNIMIELSKYENGTCKNERRHEIGKLYILLTTAMRENRILCPLGNQLQEMGMSKGRRDSKDFLYRFTNSELLNPDEIEEIESKIGYQTFVKNENTIHFNSSQFFVKDSNISSPFIIKMAPEYNQEKLVKLQNEKQNIVNALNDAKSKCCINTNIEEQIKNELNADFQVLSCTLENLNKEQESFTRCLDTIGVIHSHTGLLEKSHSEQDIILTKYVEYLQSAHHHNLPYKWIQANLWAHRMQRHNKIVQGDYLDTKWASAYIPFIDYAVTDNDCCNLIQNSGLANQYNTKVFSLKTINELISII